MINKLVFGILLVGVGGILVYLARFLLKKFIPQHANEKGIIILKLIGFTLVAAGAFAIFFIGAGEYK